MKNIKLIFATTVCGALLAFCPKVNAITLSVGDAYTLGYINPDNPANPATEAEAINFLITLSPGTGPTVDNVYGSGQTLSRTANVFTPLDAAALAVNVGTISGNPSTVTINVGTGGYEYIAAKYDGPNYGAVVWYIGGLTGNITIPGFPTPGSGQYGISGYNIYTPYSVPTASTPDGGTTGLLLGAAFSGLALLKRRFM